MKKLLFSLGTVAAIVAPVAAVVACGSKSHDAKTPIKERIVKDAYEQFGYTIKFGNNEANKVSFNQLVDGATDFKLFGGKITDESNKDVYHDADDLAIVVYGKSLNLPSDATKDVYYNAEDNLTNGSEQVIPGDENAKNTLKGKWGFDDAALNNAQAIIFMHYVETSDDGYDITWETAQVYHGKIVGSESKNWIKDVAQDAVASGDDIDMSVDVANN